MSTSTSSYGVADLDVLDKVQNFISFLWTELLKGGPFTAVPTFLVVSGFLFHLYGREHHEGRRTWLFIVMNLSLFSALAMIFHCVYAFDWTQLKSPIYVNTIIISEVSSKIGIECKEFMRKVPESYSQHTVNTYNYEILQKQDTPYFSDIKLRAFPPEADPGTGFLYRIKAQEGKLFKFEPGKQQQRVLKCQDNDKNNGKEISYETEKVLVPDTTNLAEESEDSSDLPLITLAQYTANHPIHTEASDLSQAIALAEGVSLKKSKNGTTALTDAEKDALVVVLQGQKSTPRDRIRVLTTLAKLSKDELTGIISRAIPSFNLMALTLIEYARSPDSYVAGLAQTVLNKGDYLQILHYYFNDSRFTDNEKEAVVRRIGKKTADDYLTTFKSELVFNLTRKANFIYTEVIPTMLESGVVYIVAFEATVSSKSKDQVSKCFSAKCPFPDTLSEERYSGGRILRGFLSAEVAACYYTCCTYHNVHAYFTGY